MERSSDIRVERTRGLLLDALVHLMRERDATQVSVAQLTRTAQVNRSTFYAHYVDIFDFLGLFPTMCGWDSGEIAGGTPLSL